MLVTKEWSDPKPVESGRNILVRSPHGNFTYKIYSAKGKSVEGIIHDRVHIIQADDERIRLIRFPGDLLPVLTRMMNCMWTLKWYKIIQGDRNITVCDCCCLVPLNQLLKSPGF